MANVTGDLTRLRTVDAASVLEALRVGYMGNDKKPSVYYSLGKILVAVNPYRSCPSLYTDETMRRYQSSDSSEPSAHIYKVAETCYRSFMRAHRYKKAKLSQSLIACGESGSGKTETCKHLMKYLAFRTRKDTASTDPVHFVQANYIIEAFGNARTQLNDNSSRFGKFTKLEIDEQYTIMGSMIETYLLELSRVVKQGEGERNFHIFHYLCLLPEATRDSFRVGSDSTTDSKSGFVRPCTLSIIDRSRFDEMLEAMEHIGIDEPTRNDVFRIVAAVLHLGRVEFDEQKNDACSIVNDGTVPESPVALVTSLLGIECGAFSSILTSCLITMKSETVTRTRSCEEARRVRNTIAKMVYQSLFRWIIERINQASRRTNSDKAAIGWIGILDVFGFETFTVNSLEQLLINYCNERLQSFFNEQILNSEQQLYMQERIQWECLTLPDNSNVMRLFQDSVYGLFSALDATCKLNSSVTSRTERDFLAGVTSGPSVFFKHPGTNNLFRVIHYAGPVEYDATGFLEKNSEKMDAKVVEVLAASSVGVIRECVSQQPQPSNATPGHVRSFSERTRATPSQPQQSRSSGSLVSTFSGQVDKVIADLATTEIFFIRCVNPNPSKNPTVFDAARVQQQLKSGGMIEALKIMTTGYPSRCRYDDLLPAYTSLIPEGRRGRYTNKEMVRAIFSLVGEGKSAALEASEYQLGETMVFFKSGKQTILDRLLHEQSSIPAERLRGMNRRLVLMRTKRLTELVMTKLRLLKRHAQIRRYMRLRKLVQTILPTWKRTHRRKRFWALMKPVMESARKARAAKRAEAEEAARRAAAKKETAIGSPTSTDPPPAVVVATISHPDPVPTMATPIPPPADPPHIPTSRTLYDLSDDVVSDLKRRITSIESRMNDVSDKSVSDDAKSESQLSNTDLATESRDVLDHIASWKDTILKRVETGEQNHATMLGQLKEWQTITDSKMSTAELAHTTSMTRFESELSTLREMLATKGAAQGVEDRIQGLETCLSQLSERLDSMDTIDMRSVDEELKRMRSNHTLTLDSIAQLKVRLDGLESWKNTSVAAGADRATCSEVASQNTLKLSTMMSELAQRVAALESARQTPDLYLEDLERHDSSRSRTPRTDQDTLRQVSSTIYESSINKEGKTAAASATVSISLSRDGSDPSGNCCGKCSARLDMLENRIANDVFDSALKSRLLLTVLVLTVYYQVNKQTPLSITPAEILNTPLCERIIAKRVPINDVVEFVTNEIRTLSGSPVALGSVSRPGFSSKSGRSSSRTKHHHHHRKNRRERPEGEASTSQSGVHVSFSVDPKKQ